MRCGSHASAWKLHLMTSASQVACRRTVVTHSLGISYISVVCAAEHHQSPQQQSPRRLTVRDVFQGISSPLLLHSTGCCRMFKLRVRDWQFTTYLRSCQPLFAIYLSRQNAVAYLTLGNVYDNGCNVVDGLTTNQNPCTQGIFGCSPAPIIFNRYTNTFTGTPYVV